MKIVVISDTHTCHSELVIPKGDMIIHCGDFSHSPQSVFSFAKWYSELDFKYKILIAGNHDTYVETVGYDEMFKYSKEKGIIYLEDTSVEIEGIKIFGSPYSLQYGNWAFMDMEHTIFEHWAKIPDDVNILVTHGPAYQVGDKVYMYSADGCVGSKTLKNRIEYLPNLKYHFFGHIHEDYGMFQKERLDGSTYVGVNASVLNSIKL